MGKIKNKFKYWVLQMKILMGQIINKFGVWVLQMGANMEKIINEFDKLSCQVLQLR